MMRNRMVVGVPVVGVVLEGVAGEVGEAAALVAAVMAGRVPERICAWTTGDRIGPL